MDFYTAWEYLYNHKIFKGHFQQCLDIEVVKINPKTHIRTDDENGKTEIWIECGPYLDENNIAHDIDLDCGGYTFEEAIIKLAKNVKKFYDDKNNMKKYIDYDKKQ